MCRILRPKPWSGKGNVTQQQVDQLPVCTQQVVNEQHGYLFIGENFLLSITASGTEAYRYPAFMPQFLSVL